MPDLAMMKLSPSLARSTTGWQVLGEEGVRAS
jgi:hypothetical protein